MLEKMRTVRPTHLWHVTSQKAFQAAIRDRPKAIKNMNTRLEPWEFIKMCGIVWGSALVVMWSFGLFNPEKTLQTILPDPCKPNTPPAPTVVCKPAPKGPKKKPVCPSTEPKTKPKSCTEKPD